MAVHDFFNAWVSGGEPPRIAESIGIRMKHCADGSALLEFTADPRHPNPVGTTHGGVLCYLGDTAMGFA